jgi:Dyp-type peroxidase family
MILLAHNDPTAIAAKASEIRRFFDGLAWIAIEQGAAITDGKLNREHFGFIDGVSQPEFFQSGVPAAAGPDQWDPSAGPNLVLVRDPLGRSDEDCGSYFVFRKLRQDVEGFRQREADLRNTLTPSQHPELAGAFVVGRFRDGTSVAVASSPQGQQGNDFLYRGSGPATGADPHERRCPLSSHIRKVNPRGDTGNLAKERDHRIARRGIAYGAYPADPEVGLLFQCCQRSLEDQFEFLQKTWMNPAAAPTNDAGMDPVAGAACGSHQNWPKTWDTGLKVKLDFGAFVTLVGGAYFFLPSITFLKRA